MSDRCPINSSCPVVQLPRLLIASRWHERLFGLLTKPALSAGQALLLRPCNAVHSFFMRQTIDVVFLDGAGRVLSVRPHLRPWRVAADWRAHQALELADGQARSMSLRPGVRVHLTGRDP